MEREGKKRDKGRQEGEERKASGTKEVNVRVPRMKTM